MKNFVRRPQPVQALQFDGTINSAHAILKWMGCESDTADLFMNDPIFGPSLRFEDVGNIYRMKKTDWVVWENFHFKVKSDRIFRRDYEPSIITAQVTPAPEHGSYDENQSLPPPPGEQSPT